MPASRRDRDFIARVWEEGAAHGRDDLPWRNLDDPYPVWLSEAMLQQTQVKRVLAYWRRFLAAFPAIDALAAASTSDVLELWQGLGYNRRALALKRTAEICSERHAGTMPRGLDELMALPGIGPATAAGIRAFAFQLPGVYLETNVRAVVLHEYFPDCDKVPDREIAPILERTCSEDDPRGWYYALLDWGAHLKSTGTNPSRRSAHYARQSAFEGSRRQKRAFIVREVLAQPGIVCARVGELLDGEERASGRPAVDPAEFAGIVEDLVSEGFFAREGDALRP
ncbi:adenine glycosylase [Curtanaerobium respiraculi]|uniref:adenine glycosylase n=1 Tax=Curtanaerobium respiraculi TaxID=2949669 RepID=UPI0024B3B6C3|nr:adenine glycosylase [Curtanaerobium respiraculi]